MINFILFLTAYILYLPLSITNFFFVKARKGYFLSSALNLDIFANREFRTLWNKMLRTYGGYRFGRLGETISSALGKNQRDGTLSKTGRRLANLLDFIDKDHCMNSIKVNNY